MSPVLTIAEIASKAGLPRQTVARRLEGLGQDSVRIVQGASVKAWRVQSLPADIKDRLLECAISNGRIASEVQPWKPAIPLAEAAPDAIERAEKLRRALALALDAARTDLSVGEKEARGVAEYQRLFGHGITPRHFRRLLNRTLARAGSGELTRIELYLDENPRRALQVSDLAPTDELRAIADEIDRFGDRMNPSSEERAVLWDAVYRLLEQQPQARRKQFKRKLRAYLWRGARFLAVSENSLRVQLDRYYSRWINGGRNPASLVDGREAKRGQPKPGTMQFNELDKERIEFYARENCGGRLAQAMRELSAMGEESGLSRELIGYVFEQQSDSKYYCNRRLREAVTPNIKATMPYRLGKRVTRNQRPKLQRLYDNLHSMQVVCADDFTWPVYFYISDQNGGYKLMRGQCLLFIDVRSLCVLNWTLIPAEQYDSLAIRSLMNQVCREFAVPRIWYFEMGIWKKSHIVKNTAPADWSLAHSDSELKLGWENFGCKFIHAQGPQAKPIEKVGDLLQNLMERCKGYCGRDERRDCPGETQRNKLAVEARRELPAKYFFSFEEWEAELGRMIAIYNSTRQDGDILKGQSPDEAFEAYQNADDPPMRWDANTWHLGAHYVREFTVGNQGIQFKFGKRTFKYFDAQTGELEFQKVLAWFDPENPECIAITDLARKNPRIIPIHKPTDFLAVIDPDSEEADAFRNEIAKARAHGAVAKNRYHAQKAKFKMAVRPNLVDGRTMAVAQQMDAARTEFKRDRTEKMGREQSIRKMVARLERRGINTPRIDKYDEAAERSLKEFIELLPEDDQ